MMNLSLEVLTDLNILLERNLEHSGELIDFLSIAFDYFLDSFNFLLYFDRIVPCEHELEVR